MTIKRRIFWSNVLMVIIPVLLCIIVATGVANLMLDRMGFNSLSHKSSNRFYHIIQTIQKNNGLWAEAGDPDQIIADLAESGFPSEEDAVSLAICRNQDILVTAGGFTANELVRAAMAMPDNTFFTVDHMALYTVPVGDLQLYLLNTEHEYGEAGLIEGRNSSFPVGGAVMLLLITCILVTNWSLTHVMFRSIIDPLEILVDGVHKLKNGDMGYRIHYTRKDEFAGVCHDFNNMAEQLEKLIEARRRDDESRRELIAGISHDLRTPLTSIKAYVEGLTAGVASTPALQMEYLDIITAKTNDLDHLIGQLFQFTKLDVGDFPFTLEDLDVGVVIADYVRIAEKEYEDRGLKLISESIETGIMVHADEVQLHNIFTNFLENTLKYGAKEDGVSRIAYRRVNDSVEISFTDNGPGVPEELLDKLFHVFYRADKARRAPGQSSGLGLAISDKLIRGLGGSLRAENAAGGGLCMVIVLPVAGRGEEDEEDIDR